MPSYTIEAPDGAKFKVEGDSPPTEQELEEIYSSLASTPVEAAAPKLAPSGRTPEQEAIAQAFIASEQRPALAQAREAALGLGNALLAPFKAGFKALPAIPEVVESPSRLIPTAGEAARRLGMDIGSIATAAARQVPGLIQRGPIGTLQQQLSGLFPRTPTEAEVDAAVAEAPLQEALAQVRQEVRFEGAQPEIAEAVTQVVEAAPPIKGLQALRGFNVAKASPARILRAAIKPGKQFGARVEKASENTIADIFNANPIADQVAATPFEGFQRIVASVQGQVGAQIDEGLKASNFSINAGDQMAQALLTRADELARAGQPADTILTLQNRAADLTGRVTDMDSLRESVTLANRANSPLFQRSREAANPMLAQADTIANEIIAKVGGKIENDALAAVKGPGGEALRKKWADLNLINQEASKRLNTLINTAPPEIQSALTSSLTSLEGAAGLVGLMQGYAAGVVPLVTAAAKKWQKNVERSLRDSNSLVTSAYEKLRANPPAAPASLRAVPPPTPPPLPNIISPQAQLNAAIAQSISSQTPMPRLNPNITPAPNFTSTTPFQSRIPPTVGGVPSQAILNEAAQRLAQEQFARQQLLRVGDPLSAAIAQSISSQTPIARIPTSVSFPPNFTSNPPTAIRPPVIVGGVPSQAIQDAVLQRILQDQAAERARMLLEGSNPSEFYY